MNITLDFDSFNDSLVNKFNNIKLILDKNTSSNNINLLLNTIKKNISISLENISSNIDFINKIPKGTKIDVIVRNENDVKEVIYYQILLNAFNTTIKLIGNWDDILLKSIKKISHLRFRLFIYFNTIETITQDNYENLLNFIYYRSLQFNIIEPFRSLFIFYFTNSKLNNDLFKIYNEIPEKNAYIYNKNVYLGLLWKHNKRSLGSIDKNHQIKNKKELYKQIVQYYHKDFPEDSKCLKCEHNKICSGYIYLLYKNCSDNWVEIFNTLKDISASANQNQPSIISSPIKKN